MKAFGLKCEIINKFDIGFTVYTRPFIQDANHNKTGYSMHA
jgi:hypothetical protein